MKYIARMKYIAMKRQTSARLHKRHPLTKTGRLPAHPVGARRLQSPTAVIAPERSVCAQALPGDPNNPPQDILIAYSPLAMGALTGKYSATTKASGFRRFLPNFSKKAMDAVQPVVELLHQIGDRYSKTPSQVALRWLIENPLVLPIPGAKNSKQAMNNAGALTFRLTQKRLKCSIRRQ